MKHIFINGKNNLEKEISLNNGSLVLQKNKGEVINVFMVISFRDNKNRYVDNDTRAYCTLVNLDTGYNAFEERCSRNTTVRRVLNHLLSVGVVDRDYDYGNADIEVIPVGKYNLNVEF